jgi:hypothetical protein
VLTPTAFGEPPRRHVTWREAAATLTLGCLLIAAVWTAEAGGDLRDRISGRRR